MQSRLYFNGVGRSQQPFHREGWSRSKTKRWCTAPARGISPIYSYLEPPAEPRSPAAQNQFARRLTHDRCSPGMDTFPSVPSALLRALCVDVLADERLLVNGALHAGGPRSVSTPPDALTAGAGTLQGTGSSMSAHNAAAAAPTTGVVPAAADQVSAQFATHAQIYQAVSAQAAAMHETIVNTSARVWGAGPTLTSSSTGGHHCGRRVKAAAPASSAQKSTARPVFGIGRH